MLGIGFFEIVVIALVALVFLGPKHLPQVLQKIAVYYRQFLNLREELKSQIMISAPVKGDFLAQSIKAAAEKKPENEDKSEAHHG
jgi:Tat protein translocase TatB subunit